MMYVFMDIIYTSTGSETVKILLTAFVISSITIPVFIAIIDLLFDNLKVFDVIKIKSE